MNVTGIIAEYNPFHRGHKYQINYCKKELQADYVIVVMSGDYVQRGTPALLPKHLRAEMALRCGADLVLEMPVSVSTASAETFATFHHFDGIQNGAAMEFSYFQAFLFGLEHFINIRK